MFVRKITSDRKKFKSSRHRPQHQALRQSRPSISCCYDVSPEDEAPPAVLSIDAIAQHCELLRALGQRLDRDSELEQLQQVQAHLAWLESLQREMLIPWGRSGGGKASAFQLRYLIETLLLASNLRSHVLLKPTIVAALHASLPAQFAQSFVQEVVEKNSTSIPSPASLYRHRLTLVSGFYRAIAEEHEKMLQGDGVSRYIAVDKSPQGKYEWVMTVESVIPNSQLLSTMRLSQVLFDACCDWSLEKEPVEELKDIAATLEQTLQVRLAPPVAVGSGRASRLHTLHALVHAHKLVSSSWKSACELVRGVVSLTSDLGTEALLTSIPPIPITRFFDYAVEQTEGGEALEDLEGTLPDDPSDLGGVCVDLSNAWHFPGLLHVVDNAGKSLESALVWYDTFLTYLKAISSMLTQPWTKARFMQTCMNDDSFADLRLRVSKFHAKAYSPRWGTIWRACRELSPLQFVLQRAWKKDSYVFGGGCGSDAQVTTLDEGIRSAVFWSYLSMILHLAGAQCSKAVKTQLHPRASRSATTCPHDFSCPKPSVQTGQLVSCFASLHFWDSNLLCFDQFSWWVTVGIHCTGKACNSEFWLSVLPTSDTRVRPLHGLHGFRNPGVCPFCIRI